MLKVLCLVAAVFLPAAFLPAASEADAAGGFPLRVVDALGRRVTLPAPPRRIVSVAPSLTEILFALGLDTRIVGVSSADDYPEAKVAAKPKVGGVVLDVERILSLRPDLVVGVASLQRGQLERLIAMKLPVMAVDAATLPGLYAQIELIGRLTGAPGAAGKLLAAMRTKEQVVATAVAGRPRRQVYVELWGEPLMTAGAGTFISDLITRGGGVNVFADVSGWPQVSEEAVIRRNPEVIVVTYPQGRRALTRRGWEQVAAVRAGRVGEVHASLISRPGPRIVDGLRALAAIIHPEVFR